MTPGGWARAVAMWRAVWPKDPLPAESVEVWFDLLADLDDEQVMAALAAWANSPDRSWPPKSPGELRSQLADDVEWTDAIARLALLVRRNGSYSPRPALDDPALDAYVDSVGGWTRLCRSFDPTDPAQRAQFRDHYQTVQKRQRNATAFELSAAVLPQIGTNE